MKIKILFICLLATTLFNSCKKDADETTTTTPPTSEKKALLIDKNWKLTASTVDIAYSPCGATPSTNIIGCYYPCTLDNITVFTTTNTYTVDEGPTKCSISSPQTFESGSWTFNSDETVIVKTPTGGAARTYTIVTLNATTLKLNESKIIAGVTYVFSETFTKQ